MLRLKDFIHEEDPASLRLRETQWRKYFRFDAKSDYLVLRKSLLRLQENTLMELMACLSKKYATSPYTLTAVKSNTYSSLKVVFRSVGVQTNYRCPCATDYRGESCDTGLNLCYSNPCGNNGKCVCVEEGYSCICNPGRAGVNCEIDMSKSKCHTDSKATENHLNANPCHSDGGCKK